jgi:hypothetical protein
MALSVAFLVLWFYQALFCPSVLWYEAASSYKSFIAQIVLVA